MGYVLPFGQMSLWGATVITSLMSAIPWVGQDIVEFLWGGFSVNNATLNRFFALHFVLPFVLAALALMHLIALHDSAGSGNPLGVSGNYDRLPFAPYFIFKDLITLFIFILILSIFVFFLPNLLGDSENYVMANAMQTPPAIVPEWYLLPFYAILRSIPNKLLGVIAMFSAILILLVMPFTDLSRSRGTQFKPLSKIAFFIFVCNFLILMELGAKHVESPFIEFGQISTVIYFAHFLIIVPLISLFENTLTELSISIKHYIGHYNNIPSPYGGVIRLESRSWYKLTFLDDDYCYWINSETGDTYTCPLDRPTGTGEAPCINIKNQHIGVRPHYIDKTPLECIEHIQTEIGIKVEGYQLLEGNDWGTFHRVEANHNVSDPSSDGAGPSNGAGPSDPSSNGAGPSDPPSDGAGPSNGAGPSDGAGSSLRERYPWPRNGEGSSLRERYPWPRNGEGPSSGTGGPSPTAAGSSGDAPSSGNPSSSLANPNSRIMHPSVEQPETSKPQGIISELEELKSWLENLIPGLVPLTELCYLSSYLSIIFSMLIWGYRIKLLWNRRDDLITSIELFLYGNYIKTLLRLCIVILLSAGIFFVSLTYSHWSQYVSVFTTALPSYCDAPKPWGIYFQDSATPQMEGLVELHDNILFYLVIILFGVGWLLVSIVKNYTNTESPVTHKYLSHGTLVELIWTITPALILILIAFPSFKLLYLMDEVSDPAMAVLAEGFFTGGLKLHILNKIKDTSLIGEKNTTLVPKLAQVESTSFLSTRYRKHNFTTFSFFYIKKTKPVCSNLNKTFHTKVKASNRIGPHNEEVISVLIGSLLGDSYASARTIEGTRFSYKQSEGHKDYLFWLYEFYYKRGYCSNLKPRMYARKLRNKVSNDIKQHYGYEFNTFTFRSFNWIYKLFYKKGTKTVSAKLEQYLTPLALAIWIMDDGGWAKPGVRISSNSFKLQEVQLLANLLKKLFYLNCTVQKINTPGQYSIYIKGESISKLRKLVLPHVIPSMRYKFGL